MGRGATVRPKVSYSDHIQDAWSSSYPQMTRNPGSECSVVPLVILQFVLSILLIRL